MVPFLSLLVAILISYLDSKAEKNMLADNKNQETSKPVVKFSITAITEDLLDSLKFLSLDLVVLFIMCICFYVGVFTWMTQISDFFEVYKGLPNASNVKALFQFFIQKVAFSNFEKNIFG